MIDKNSKFIPSEKEAYETAKNYWNGLTNDREKLLEIISNSIKNFARVGGNVVYQVVPKKDEEYIKQKLEDVGYTISFNPNSNDTNTDIMTILFNK